MKLKIKLLVFIASWVLFAGSPLHAQKKAAPIFKDGMTQIVPEFNKPDEWIIHDLWVETTFDTDGDGRPDRMHVDVTRPKQTETEGLKLPVIYESSPYFAGTGTGDLQYFWNPKQELGSQPEARKKFPPMKPRNNRPVISKAQVARWVPQGYIVVHSSSPGTGLSQGCPTVGGDNESLAPKAVIDWLNGRAKGYTTPDGFEEVKAYWTTGKVGMTGTSYDGTLPLAAATTGVDGLEVIIPIAPNTSYYHYYRTNGLIRHPGGWLGEDIDVLYDFIHSQPEHCDYCDSVVKVGQMLANHDRVKGDFNDWWAGRDYLNDMGPMKCAMLMAHGFNDWNVVPEHSYRIYEAAKAKGLPVKIYYHQGGHGGEPPFEMMNKWFAKFLYGVENDALEGPRAYIVRENAGRDAQPVPYADYPNPDAKPVQLFLTAGAPKAGELVLVKKPGQGIENFVDNYNLAGAALAQKSWSAQRLLFVTPPLKEAVHISGIPQITIRLACNKPAANLSVWMVQLPWNTERRAPITDNIINRGWADPQNYKSLRESEPLVPDQFYELTFNLQPDDQIIPAGKQIALMIFSSDKDFTLHPEPGTELMVDLDATSITLPVVGGAAAYMKATRVQ
ncbi:MAG: Xaa-Pro dipeptidyl-peptidase [Bacteroidetes bacterium GWF2_49_14]|nr:MAG: Xaa-Pro dipeptidyl-peptidase [Bacteroidetes bacterium GWF2_49_14]